MNKECELCIKRKTIYCPNSSECYETTDKPYYLNRIMLLEENKQLEQELHNSVSSEHFQDIQKDNEYLRKENKRLKEDNQAMQEEMARTWEKLDKKEKKIQKAINWVERNKHRINVAGYTAEADAFHMLSKPSELLKILESSDSNE